MYILYGAEDFLPVDHARCRRIIEDCRVTTLPIGFSDYGVDCEWAVTRSLKQVEKGDGRSDDTIKKKNHSTTLMDNLTVFLQQVQQVQQVQEDGCPVN